MSSAPLKMGHAVSILRGPKTGMDLVWTLRSLCDMASGGSSGGSWLKTSPIISQFKAKN